MPQIKEFDTLSLDFLNICLLFCYSSLFCSFLSERSLRSPRVSFQERGLPALGDLTLHHSFWWVRYEGSASAAWEKRLPRQPERHTAYPHSDGQWRSSRRAGRPDTCVQSVLVRSCRRPCRPVGVDPWTERVAGGRAAHRRNPVKVFHRSIRAQGRTGTVPERNHVASSVINYCER